jgi:hypothetical protein
MQMETSLTASEVPPSTLASTLQQAAPSDADEDISIGIDSMQGCLKVLGSHAPLTQRVQLVENVGAPELPHSRRLFVVLCTTFSIVPSAKVSLSREASARV